MYKQLAAWMLHGLLLDQSEEFFVKQGPSAGGAAANQEEEEEDLGLGGLSGKQLRELQDLVRAPVRHGTSSDPGQGLSLGHGLMMSRCVVTQRLIEEENMLAPSLQQFSLRTEMLPSYIPIRVAEKILFVGESVQMFENHNHSPSRAGRVQRREVWAWPSVHLLLPKVSVFPLKGCGFAGWNRRRLLVPQQVTGQARRTRVFCLLFVM